MEDVPEIAGTPTMADHVDKDDVELSREDLDNLQWQDLRYIRTQTQKIENDADKVFNGNFIDFPLPTPHIDECTDTPYVVRQLGGLRDRLDARREESWAALQTDCLRSLSQVQAKTERDVMVHEGRNADTKSLSAFAARMAAVRQGRKSEFISKVHLFSLQTVTQEEQLGLVGKLQEMHYARGDLVFSEGSVGDKIFIVESGICTFTNVLKGENKMLSEFKPGDSFGDMAVVYDMPRTASATATTALKLLALSRQDIISTVGEESLEKMRTMARMQLLEATPVFTDLSLEQKSILLKHMRTDVFRVGRQIMREGWRSGTANRRVYIIERGRCSVGRGGVAHAATEDLTPGTNFGNIEFAFGCPQLSTVTATTELTTMSIGFDELKDALGEKALLVIQRSMHLKLLRGVHPKLNQQDKQTCESVLDQGTIRRFEKWQPILRKGDAITHVMMLDRGVCIEHDGDMHTLMENEAVESAASKEHSHPGDTFDTHRAIDEKGAVSPYTLVALDGGCSVWFLPVEVLKSLQEPHLEQQKRRRYLSSLPR